MPSGDDEWGDSWWDSLSTWVPAWGAGYTGSTGDWSAGYDPSSMYYDESTGILYGDPAVDLSRISRESQQRARNSPYWGHSEVSVPPPTPEPTPEPTPTPTPFSSSFSSSSFVPPQPTIGASAPLGVSAPEFGGGPSFGGRTLGDMARRRMR